jgi:hypothetical protein
MTASSSDDWQEPQAEFMREASAEAGGEPPDRTKREATRCGRRPDQSLEETSGRVPTPWQWRRLGGVRA